MCLKKETDFSACLSVIFAGLSISRKRLCFFAMHVDVITKIDKSLSGFAKSKFGNGDGLKTDWSPIDAQLACRAVVVNLVLTSGSQKWYRQ